MIAHTVTDSDLQQALAAFRAQARCNVLSGTRYQMRYFCWGSGAPIVFLHGMADLAQAFIMVMNHLVERRTCIAYELPDGTTDGSSLSSYSHADYVADLIELLDHLEFPQAVVLGSSFGSTIALEALARRPERFTHGILQGAFAHRPLSFYQRYLSHVARHWHGWVADWPIIFRRVLLGVERQTFAVLPPLVSRFLLENGGRTPLCAAALRSIMIDRMDLRPLLPAIRAPVLLIGGDSDPLVPKKCELEILENLRNGERVEFSGCGHYPQYSHPISMALAVKNFLENAENTLPLKSALDRP
jgi:pimeloyl-ACP methyl ester carboxylesterase